MVKVTSYFRTRKGKRHKVSTHNRATSKRGNYKINTTRQLPAKYKKGSFSWNTDSSIKAKKPGKRLSQSKNIYYERRFNRSDKNLRI